MRKNILLLCCCMGICLVMACCMGYSEQKTTVLEEVSKEEEKEPEKKQEMICVYICGQVVNPGVYELEKDSRIFEAVQLAGGFTDQADLEEVNQAQKMEDGQQISIPSIQDKEANDSGETSDGKIDINRATLDELKTLPGIGQSKAESILKYREENGRFKKPEDLMNIEGIKGGVFQKIKDKIAVK